MAFKTNFKLPVSRGVVNQIKALTLCCLLEYKTTILISLYNASTGTYMKTISTSILDRLRKIHPELDFSTCCPSTTGDRIEPICKLHGKFSKDVLKMLYKPFQGCPKCGAGRRNKDRQVTKEMFDKAVRELWGDRFDTTASVIKGTKYNTKVICKRHGEITVNMGNFYRGYSGCTQCELEASAADRTMSQQEFIERAQHILGESYLFDKVKYTNSQTKVTITCSKHGDYDATPSSILHGKSGCRKCGYKKAGAKQKRSKGEEYKQILEERYGDTYDLSLTEYVDRKTPLIVICKKHGPFTVEAWAFLNGRVGCTFCSGKYLCNDACRKKLEEVHGKDRYTYDLIETTKKKFGVTCNECGNKWYALYSHLAKGSGCPVCAKSGFHPDRPATLYCIEFTIKDNVRVFKLGITNNSVLSRIMGMKVHPKVSYRLIEERAFDIGRDAYDKEQEMMDALKDYAYTGKPFLKNGFTEVFTINPFTHKKECD